MLSEDKPSARSPQPSQPPSRLTLSLPISSSLPNPVNSGVEGISPLDIPLAVARSSQDFLSSDDPHPPSDAYGDDQSGSQDLDEDGPQPDVDEFESYWRDNDLGDDFDTQLVS